VRYATQQKHRPAEVVLKSLVSIIINNFNYGRFVADAIDSALAQTYSNCEVIVVDDGSQDNSREVISRFGGRIKAVFKSNGGQSSAFNAGFAESSGDVICFLDSDDLFLPNKVQKAVDGLAICPAGWCFHHIQRTDTALNPIFTPPIPYRTGRYDFRAEQLRGKCTFSAPATSGLTFARTLLNQVMPIPEAITITSDNYLKLSSLALEPGYFIAEQYALQRMHGKNNYTGRTDATMRANVDMLIASGLRAKVPAMRSICNRWYADGLVRKWGAGASIGSVYKDSQEFLTDMSFGERMEIVARIAYKAARRSAYALAKTHR
jgi:glycosyltransferase involved in cell wall biosynthesis